MITGVRLSEEGIAGNEREGGWWLYILRCGARYGRSFARVMVEGCVRKMERVVCDEEVLSVVDTMVSENVTAHPKLVLSISKTKLKPQN